MERGSKALNVLISAPSLDSTVNVSGVSTVVRGLISALDGKVRYTHTLVGSPQKGSGLARQVSSLGNILGSLVEIVRSSASVFHSNTALNPKSIYRDMVLCALAKASGKKLLLHIHGGRYLDEEAEGSLKSAIVLLLKMADCVVFLSKTELKIGASRYPEYAAKMSSIYNSVDLIGTEHAATVRPDHPETRVVFVGRLAAEKGIDVLLKVALGRYDPPVHFTIFGDGPLSVDVVSAASSNKSLTYAGVFRHADWKTALGQHDILLLPSHSGEGMPMVVLEAMSLGTIPIATSLGSIPEILVDGERGYIVPVNDSAAIVDRIQMLASDKVLALSMRKRCRDFAAGNFDAETTSLAFLKLYENLS